MSSDKLAMFGRTTLDLCTDGMQDKYEDRILGLQSHSEDSRIDKR